MIFCTRCAASVIGLQAAALWKTGLEHKAGWFRGEHCLSLRLKRTDRILKDLRRIQSRRQKTVPSIRRVRGTPNLMNSTISPFDWHLGVKCQNDGVRYCSDMTNPVYSEIPRTVWVSVAAQTSAAPHYRGYFENTHPLRGAEDGECYIISMSPPHSSV